MTSIRARVLVLTGIAMAMTFIATGVVVFALTRSSLYNQFDEALVAKARGLAALVEEDEGQVESEIPATSERDVFEVRADGRLLARSASLGTHELQPTAGTLGIRESVLPDGRAARQVTLRFQPRLEPDEVSVGPIPMVTLVLARATAEVDDNVGRIAKVLIGVGIGGTLLGLLLLMIVVRLALSPIHELADAIAAVREDTLTASFAGTTTPEELRPIVVRLDELIRRLAKAFARERELTAEVAHELRTPLSGLRVTIEVALGRDRAADRYRTALVDCLAITKQTESAVQTMLSLARLDAGVTKVQPTRFDLEGVVAEALAPITLRAEERKIAVTSALPASLVETDAEMLRLVVQNLLDNAVSYCDEGGSIDVTLRPGELRVSNTGCTLDEQDRAHIFERFWRKDAARSAGHSGLGLPLCRRIMDALGGSIAVEIENGSFVATVTVPT